MEGKFAVTGQGAVETEQGGLVPENIASKIKRARDLIIAHLASVYKGQGYLAGNTREELRESTGIEPHIFDPLLGDLLDLN